MKSIGICTQFNPSDDWAFDLGFQIAQRGNHKLVICHWLKSPYRLRRDIVENDLFSPTGTVEITPELQVQFERQLRECFDERLGDFTNVAFKLCEGQYQVELARCFHQNLLDLVIMGYHSAPQDLAGGLRPQVEFASGFHHPVILVGMDGSFSYWLNASAEQVISEYHIPRDWHQTQVSTGVEAN